MNHHLSTISNPQYFSFQDQAVTKSGATPLAWTGLELWTKMAIMKQIIFPVFLVMA